ncbi:integrase core domain-containing protein, partial [Salmonella enterica]|uniref:integrase core domain-containing protein n=1 Tax=Salmonella enterica TaxID=28901 RepID=UPI001E32ED8B
NDGHYFCRAGGNRPDGLNEPVTFRTLNEVREITERWVSEYNCERPHESLNNMTPEEYRQHNHLAGISKNAWN